LAGPANFETGTYNLIRRLSDGAGSSIFDLVTALISGIVWIIWPEIGWWPVLIALLPWVARLRFGYSPLRWNFINSLVFIYLLSAWVGSQVAYDPISAQIKFWFIVGSVFLYLAISKQPQESKIIFAISLLVISVGVSAYFLLTHDFVNMPRRIQIINQIGIQWMEIRPQMNLPGIHPNYAAGIAVLTSLYGIFLAWRGKNTRFRFILLTMILVAFCLNGIAVVVSTSFGILLALGSISGIWVIWRVIYSENGRYLSIRNNIFPTMITLYLILVMFMVHFGLSRARDMYLARGKFGSNSRVELFQRSLYLVSDFAFTGGGLNTFPGLYSHYILVIPYYFLPNSHNMFMDVAIEQGIFGGIAFLSLYITSVWVVAKALTRKQTADLRLFSWITLFALFIAIVHGMVDNYLFNDKGAIFSLIGIGMANFIGQNTRKSLPEPSLGFHTHKIKQSWIFTRKSPVFWVGAVLLGLALFMFRSELSAALYANLGAVRMAKVELQGFPQNSWHTGEADSQLRTSEASFNTSLAFDPENPTANFRLGLIQMQRKDFACAVNYLETAYRLRSAHRGIIKNLGYSYVWVGDYQKADGMLSQIPEAKEELEVYTWWWENQGYAELSKRSVEMVAYLASK
jgi:hypothetical protein